MNNAVIRLQKVELKNFKNVKKGSIDLPGYRNSRDYEHSFSKESEIIGIYGQNGSGKTAFIEALSVLKDVMMGESLPQEIDNYIYQGENNTEINTIFSLEQNSQKYIIFYDLKIRKSQEKNKEPIVFAEELSYKKYEDNSWGYKKGIISYNAAEEDPILSPIKNYQAIRKNIKDARAKLIAVKELSRENQTSFIFSQRMEEIYQEIDNEFQEFTDIICRLKHYARLNLFVIENSRSGMINANILIPLCFQLEEEKSISLGVFPIALSDKTPLPAKTLARVKEVIKNLNIVLQEIIPDLTINIKEYGRQLNEDGEEIIEIEPTASRKDINIPLKYESDGIKKIVSILSIVIAMYNNPTICLAVDEFDAGVFEYLLGEILEIIEDRGRGQLLFTSHNLRPLEKLKKDSLIFTTTNPSNRYIRFANVKPTNNLRSFYYRGINLGGQEEKIYEETNEYKIARAFKAAGSAGENE